MPPTIFISAGEASGEAYGALLIAELQKRLTAQKHEASFFGMGGPRMAAAGLHRIVRAEDVAVMGITEVVRHLPRIYREFRKLKQSLRHRRPSIAILIDFPDIHFKLAKECRRLGIPVVFFVSPQLWAWKKHRIKLVQQYVDRMLVIFPFEEPFYRERGVHAEFVGHPLAELPAPTISREEFAARNNLDPQKSWIALLPGSRVKEIRDNLPEMLAAALLLDSDPRVREDHPKIGSPPTSGIVTGHDFSRAASSLNEGKGALAPEGNSHEEPALKGHDFSRAASFPPKGGASAPEGSPPLQFILPLAPTLTDAHRNFVRRLAENHSAGLTLNLVSDARAALHHARASIVASGTATVEAALIGNPFVVVYRVSPLTYAIAKRVVTVPHVAMVNLIAQKRVIPELIQNEFTASNIVSQMQPLLPDGAPRQSMMKELAELRGMLRARSHSSAQPTAGAIARVAEVVLELLGVAQRTGAAPTAAPEPL